MSTNIYLNKQLKDYYKYCLEEEIRLGKIDKDISNHLLTIKKYCTCFFQKRQKRYNQ